MRQLSSLGIQGGVLISRWENSKNNYNYFFKVNNRNTKKRCEICSKFTIKAPERLEWLVFLLTLNIFDTFLCLRWKETAKINFPHFRTPKSFCMCKLSTRTKISRLILHGVHNIQSIRMSHKKRLDPGFLTVEILYETTGNELTFIS